MMAKRTAEGTVILRASLVALLSAAWPAGAVLLELPASGTKCVSEEIHANVLVVAVYTVVHHADSPTISSKELQQNCINLNRRIGLAAKDWDSVARKEKLEGVELELKKLEELVKAIHENLLHLKNREADMRDMSEITNSRVAWFSIMSLGVCLTASVLQLWHLKGFFQKKKLI